jgi:hypothetical protein
MDAHALPLPPDAFGWLAAALTWMTFFCRDMRRLRGLALCANAAFIAYAALVPLWPVLMLHLALVPVNLWRLTQVLRQPPGVPATPDERAAEAVDAEPPAARPRPECAHPALDQRLVQRRQRFGRIFA